MFARGSGGILAVPPLAALFLLYLGIWPLAMALFLFWLILLVFFRDPERKAGIGIVSAADGRVDWIRNNGQWLVISVFMGLGDVHVNRAPLPGVVTKVARRAGGMWPAFLERSERNAKAVIEIDTALGLIRVVQISGVFAWRVCPYVRKGDAILKGRRIGMIRFGSRVNVWLPADKVTCAVSAGQKTVAGVTAIAEVRR